MNSKKTDSETRTIPLDNGMVAICDADTYNFLARYSWHAVKYHRCWYARMPSYRDSGETVRSMHRLIACTPANMVCHHRNRNTLDNRRANLLNMTRQEHEFLHKNNSLIIKTTRPNIDLSAPPGQL